jgi:hypothetical protein
VFSQLSNQTLGRFETSFAVQNKLKLGWWLKRLLTSTQSDGCLVSSTLQGYWNVRSGVVEVDLAETAKKLL